MSRDANVQAVLSINDILNAELEAAAGEVTCARDRAAVAAGRYVQLRLRWLEKRFPRHRFLYYHRSYQSGGMHVYPQVGKTNVVATIIRVAAQRGTRWKTLSGLAGLDREMRDVCFRIENEFQRMLGRVDPGTCPAPTAYPRIQDAARAYDAFMADAQERADREWNRHTPHLIAYQRGVAAYRSPSA